jgi:hypothetical protein
MTSKSPVNGGQMPIEVEGVDKVAGILKEFGVTCLVFQQALICMLRLGDARRVCLESGAEAIGD